MKSRDQGGLSQYILASQSVLVVITCTHLQILSFREPAENNLVYRYDTTKVDDGTGGGEEGAFSMCTLWLIESLARAGAYKPELLAQSVAMLEDYMGQ